MRVLIVGGFGFLGGRLGQLFYETGHQVVLGSRNANFPPDWLPKAQVAKVVLNDDSALEKICSGVDVVIQAAGMNAQDCSIDPVAALEINGLATARLLRAAIHSGVRRFIYISTAHVYANPLQGVVSEDNCPRNLHPYATSHLVGEHVVLGAHQRGEIEGAVLRLSNAFGAPTHKDVNCWMLLVNDLCKQVIVNGRMVLRSNGLQQRDFVTLQNACRIVEHLAVLPTILLEDGLFNSGSGSACSVYDMALLVAKRCKAILGFIPPIQRIEPQVTDVANPLNFSIAKLISTGFLMDSQIEDEIDATILFCLENFGHVND